MPAKRYLTVFFVITLCTFFIIVTKVQAKEPGNIYPVQGKTILLDPGHGGRDHGYCKKGSVCEKDTAMEVTQRVAARLRESGAKVYLTREKNCFLWFPWPGKESEISLDKRILLARAKKADIFVSIHCNASPKPHRAGAVVFYQDNSSTSRLLGNQIQRELVKIPENSKRTDKPGSYYLLNKLSVPAVVIETCYLTHKADKENIVNPKYQEKIARAIFLGITNYFFKQENTGNIPASPESDNTYHENIFKEGQNRTSPLWVPAGYDRTASRFRDNEALSFLKSASTVSGDLKIDNVKVSGNQASVNIKTAHKGLSLGGEEEYHAVYTIINNALKIPGIQSILLTLNGKTAETLAGHIDISLPITRKNSICSPIPFGTKDGKNAQIAIVIDDFGQYNTDGVKEIFSLDIPVTCAVMPNLENTRIHAEEAAKLGNEVIVHLPLEPVKGKKEWLGPGSITTNMSEEEIKKRARNDFDGVPYAVGFNNHMGSAVTANDKIMRSILQAALEKEFFVLDSRTTDKTRIPALSDELGITYLERTVFLDDIKNLNHVKKQLLKLSQEALKRGKAIGIGHVGQGGKITAQALKEMIPIMEEMGLEFVYLSEMAY